MRREHSRDRGNTRQCTNGAFRSAAQGFHRGGFFRIDLDGKTDMRAFRRFSCR